MLSAKWEQIIESISYVKPETIDKEKLKSIIKYDRTNDAQVLDSLYMLDVLSLEEYKEAMKRCIETLKESVIYTEKQLKDAEERGADYNPMIYYGCFRGYMGGAIEHERNKD